MVAANARKNYLVQNIPYMASANDSSHCESGSCALCR